MHGLAVDRTQRLGQVVDLGGGQAVKQIITGLQVVQAAAETGGMRDPAAEVFLHQGAHLGIAIKAQRFGKAHQGGFAQAQLAGDAARRQESRLFLVLTQVIGDLFFTFGQCSESITDQLVEINSIW